MDEVSLGFGTRVAAEGHLAGVDARIGNPEVPVFVDPHGGGVAVPAGVTQQQVFITGQHLSNQQRAGRRHQDHGLKHNQFDQQV